MAFTFNSFFPQRAFINCSLTDSTIATHSYISPDTMTTMTTPGYFPPYFGLEPGLIKLGDFVEVSSFGTNSPIQNELNFNYRIASLNPVSLIRQDEFYYDIYQFPYLGAASGGFSIFSFTRDSGGDVTVLMINNQQYNIISATTINFFFNLPDTYLPDPGLYPAGYFGPCISSVQVGASPPNSLNLEFRIIGNQCSFAVMPNSTFNVGNIITLYSPSFKYKGKPLV